METLKGHSNRVIKVQWNPHVSSIIGSSSYDRTMCIWDLSREKTEKNDSFLMFEHAGHRSKVVDFDWSKNEKLFVGSVEECNSVHVWQMAQSTYYH